MPDAAALQPALAKVAQTLARLRAAGPSQNEANTKGALIEPVLAALGWDVADPGSVWREWRGDEKGRGNPVDYALFPGPDQPPALLVEAKPLDENLEDIAWIGQTTSYANTQDVAWCVLTDGAQWDVYKAHARGRGIEKRFFRASLDDLPAALESFRLLCRDALIPPLLEQAWEARELRRKVEDALQADRADLDALVRRLQKRLPGLDKKQIRRALQGLPQPPLGPLTVPQASVSPPRPRRPKTAATAAPATQPQATGTPCVLPLSSAPGDAAVGRLSADLKEMTLLAGSLIRRAPAGVSPPFVGKTRDAMRQADVLEPAGADRWRLRQDWPAGGPSTAATIVRGPSQNGWIRWRLADGRPIDALRKEVGKA